MCIEEGKDGNKRGDIFRGRARLLGGEVDVATVGGDKDVAVPATRFHGQLTSEVGSRGIVAENSTDETGAVEGGGVRGTGWRSVEKLVQGRVGRVRFWRSVSSFELRPSDQGR